jgi:DNA-binding NarL/FixJ family response regulator
MMESPLTMEQTNPERFRIFLVEDHPLTRSGIMHIVDSEEDMFVCGEADSAFTAHEQIKELNPDIVIADISLVDSTGIDLIQMLRRDHIEIPVLVVTMHDERYYIEKAFKAGANGYLFKRDSVNNVTDAIRQVMSGKSYSSESVDSAMSTESSQSISGDSTIVEKLSRRELQIFELLGSGNNRKEIADKLNISLKTVESHVDNMRAKLNVSSGFELVYLAIKTNLDPKDSR